MDAIAGYAVPVRPDPLEAWVASVLELAAFLVAVVTKTGVDLGDGDFRRLVGQRLVARERLVRREVVVICILSVRLEATMKENWNKDQVMI
jgi:hypothetical protein